MKRLFALALLTLATPATAQVNLNIPGLTADQQNALFAMMGPLMQAQQKAEACLKTQLGDTAMQRMQDMGRAMNREIVPLCKAGRKAEAHAVALKYADSDEGRAVMHCRGEVQPLLDDPNASKLLGRYAPMARELASGHIPDDVCIGMKPGTQAPRIPLAPANAPGQ